MCRVESAAAEAAARLAADASPKTLAKLLARDQLAALLRAPEAHPLQAFREAAPPTFPPTYKFVPDSDEYDARRTPSWTDRVLWRCNYLLEGAGAAAPVVATGYAAVAGMRQSDHRPVAAGFAVALKHSAPLLLDEAVDAAAAYGRGRPSRRWLGAGKLSRGRPRSVSPVVTGPLRANAVALEHWG